MVSSTKWESGFRSGLVGFCSPIPYSRSFDGSQMVIRDHILIFEINNIYYSHPSFVILILAIV